MTSAPPRFKLKTDSTQCTLYKLRSETTIRHLTLKGNTNGCIQWRTGCPKINRLIQAYTDFPKPVLKSGCQITG